MKNSKIQTRQSNVKKKISHRFHGLLGTIFLLFLFMLFIILLRSQTLMPLIESGFNSNPQRTGTYNTPPTREAGGTVRCRDTFRPPAVSDWLDRLIEKIRLVESSNKLNPPDGDGGNAIGPLQIHQCVIDDVNEKFGTNFTIDDCRKIESAELIARLYIQWWMDAYKEEIAARIFNGGPRGWRKRSTDGYYKKIRKVNIAG